MAKKKASTSRKRSPSRSSEISESHDTSSSNFSEFDMKGKLRELVNDPTVRYVAAGLATAMLTRFATKIGDRYPEVSSFIKNNLDIVGDRFGIENQEGKLQEDTRH